MVVTRTGWSGEVGYEIYLRDGSRGVELWDRVMDAGRDLGITPTGPSDIRRVEAGILNYGTDMTLDTNPYEVGLGWQVDLGQEGDFIGREALARIAAEGPSRMLAGVEIDGAPLDLNMTRWPVRGDGGEIGFVTSAVYSPRLGRNIGYAMVPADSAEMGTRLRVCHGRRGNGTPWWRRGPLSIRTRRFRSRRRAYGSMRRCQSRRACAGKESRLRSAPGLTTIRSQRDCSSAISQASRSDSVLEYEVRTTRRTDGVRLAASRTLRVPAVAGSMRSRSGSRTIAWTSKPRSRSRLTSQDAT